MGVDVQKFARELFSSMHVAMIMPMSIVIGKMLPGSSVGADAALLGKLLGYNAAASGVQAVSQYLEALIAEALFVLGKNWYYKFLLNPSNVNFSHTKLQTVEETSDLTIINTYRNAAASLTFKGISGCTIPRQLIEIAGTSGGVAIQNAMPKTNEAMLKYPKLSAAWLKFRQLEKFYNEVNSDIVLTYDMDIYVGKLVSLNYSMDSNNPWVINYDLAFKLYPGMALHTFNIYDYKPFFDAMYERYGRSFADDFEGKSKKTSKKPGT